MKRARRAPSRLLDRLSLGPTSLCTLLIVVAALARMAGFTDVFAGGRMHLIDPDSHYHAYRIDLASRSFPRLAPKVDPLVNAPQGYELLWPPAFDYLGGALTRLLGTPPDVTGSALVILLGALTAVPVFFISRRLGLGPAPAFLAGLLLALWPIHVEYTRIGRVDHHAFEALLSALALLAILRSREQVGSGRRSPTTAALLPGLILGLCFWAWPTALLTAGVLIGALLAEITLAPRPTPRRSRLSVLLLIAAAAVVLPLAFRLQPTSRWSFQVASLAHVMLLLGGATAMELGRHLDAWGRRRRQGARQRWLLVFAAAVMLLVAMTLLSPMRASIAVLWDFSSRAGIWGLLREQRPLYALKLAHIPIIATYLIVAVPPLAYLALRHASEAHRPTARLAVMVGLAFFAGGILQLRFLPIGVALCAPLCVAGLANVVRWSRRRLVGRSERRWVYPGAAAIMLYAISPALDYLLDNRFVPRNVLWMRERAARWLHRESAPHDVLLSTLGLGNLLVNIARRPVVGTMLIEPRTEEAARDVFAFFTATDDAEALAIARRRHVKWIVSTRLPPHRYRSFKKLLAPKADRKQLGARFRWALATRLQTDRGTAAIHVKRFALPPLRWLQHRFESPRSGVWRPIEIYRIVAGARLRGHAAPRTRITLALTLVTNAGVRFIYRDAQRTTADGRFSFTVPYDTEAGSSRLETRAKGALSLRSGDAHASVHISRRAVERGETIRVYLHAQSASAPTSLPPVTSD